MSWEIDQNVNFMVAVCKINACYKAVIKCIVFKNREFQKYMQILVKRLLWIQNQGSYSVSVNLSQHKKNSNYSYKMVKRRKSVLGRRSGQIYLFKLQSEKNIKVWISLTSKKI